MTGARQVIEQLTMAGGRTQASGHRYWWDDAIDWRPALADLKPGEAFDLLIELEANAKMLRQGALLQLSSDVELEPGLGISIDDLLELGAAQWLRSTGLYRELERAIDLEAGVRVMPVAVAS